jgi:6-phosphogluconolactonase (cycloisomerase 2 family)
MLVPKLFTTGAALAPLASATLLYVSSYAENVTTLSLTLPKRMGQRATNGSLKTIAVNGGCAPNPSWLTLDSATSTLYCTNEGLSTPNGTLASFKTSKNGTLTLLDVVDTLSGPVSSVVYCEHGKGLAVAE